MKKTIIGVTAITIGLLVAGCGSDNADSVAKDFVSALSSANIKEAKNLSSDRIVEKINKLQVRCNNDDAKKLRIQTVALKEQLNEIKEDEASKKQQELLKEFIDKKKKQAGPMKAELMLEFLQKFLEISHIKIENQERVEKALAWYMISHDIDLATRKVLEEYPLEITEECVDKETEYGFIQKINFIETKEIAADEKVVRLELVDKNNNSNKVKIHVEKIKEEWKVSDI